VLSNDDRDLPSDPSPTVARHPSASPPGSTPLTFPSEAELLLRHLKIGAGRIDPPSAPGAPTPGASGFPHITGYEIECELGRGGMGVVYRARHAALRHTVAIKMILASAHAAPGEVARFVAEAEAVAAVKHPNVVQVFDLGATDGPGPDAGRPYFVMEYVDGGSLAALLKDSGSLAPRAAAELIEAVARGVHAANDAGIVHRDLKPANILLAVGSGQQAVDSKDKSKANHSSPSNAHRPLPTATPKVSDFGLAKRLSSDLTRSQAVMGTPAYMAPEQAGGKAKFVGPQADVYALGVILYQCLTGTVPFDDPDPWSLIRCVLEDAPEAPRARAPRVPRDLELICLKCLEKEPHHRYPTAAALADDLCRFLNGETVTVRPIGMATRLVRGAKKRPAIAALWIVGILLVVLVPAVAVGIQGRLDRESAVSAGAQKTALEARKAEEAARRAEEEANRARVATEELARTNELFAIQTKLRNQASARPLGWTVANLRDVPKAVALARGDQEVLRDLRSAAAAALLADDLVPADPVATDMAAAALATDPKSGLIAVGEHKSRSSCEVRVLDPVTGATIERWTYKVKFAVGQDGTRALAFSPDGTRLFAGTRYSGVVRLDRSVKSTAPVVPWGGVSGAIEQLAVSPDGKTVYGVCSTDPTVLAWAADTGKRLKPFTPPDGGRVNGIAVLPSGDLIASTGDKLHRWSADGELVQSAPAPGARRVAPGPGSLLLVGVGPRLEVYDRPTLEATDRFADPTLRLAAHEESVRTIAVHPSGAYAATAANNADRAVKVWELSSGRMIARVAVAGTEHVALAWSGDGGHLLATANRGVTRWRFAPAAVGRFACAAGPPLAGAAFAPSGRIAAVGESLGGWREVLVATGVEPAASEQAHDPAGVEHPGLTVASDGTIFIATGSGGVVWKPGSPPRGAGLAKHPVGSPRLGPGGRALWAVVDSNTVRAFDPVTLKERGVWDHSGAKSLFGVSTIDALAVGRTRTVAGGREGGVYLVDDQFKATGFHGQGEAELWLGDAVLSVAVAPDDSFVLAGTVSGKLRHIRPADKTTFPSIMAHPGGVSAVAISRDGTLLATGGRDQSIRLWKRTGDQLEPLLTVPALPGAVRRLYFSPTDGRLLVLLAHEHAVRVWDVDRLSARLAERQLGW
jgi:eukaryotic-like serine/threonine-protein kinase